MKCRTFAARCEVRGEVERRAKRPGGPQHRLRAHVKIAVAFAWLVELDFCSGSWSCKNALPREVGEKPGPVRSQATIAATSGLVPTMFMTRVRL